MPTTVNLTFKTTEGKTYNLHINNPRSNITRTEAEAVMQELITQDVIETNSGARMAGIDSVSTTVTTKTDLLI